MKNLLGLLLLSSTCLTGCVTLNEDFDCPAAKGGSCKRMDQIYEEINGGEGGSKKLLSVAPTQNPLVIEGRPGEPLRYGEGVMRIWIAPHEDTDGNYHQANQVYSVVREGHWIQNPPKDEK